MKGYIYIQATNNVFHWEKVYYMSCTVGVWTVMHVLDVIQFPQDIAASMKHFLVSIIWHFLLYDSLERGWKWAAILSLHIHKALEGREGFPKLAELTLPHGTMPATNHASNQTLCWADHEYSICLTVYIYISYCIYVSVRWWIWFFTSMGNWAASQHHFYITIIIF